MVIIGNCCFGWKVPDNIDSSIAFEKSQIAIEEVKLVITRCHTKLPRFVMFENLAEYSQLLNQLFCITFIKN